MPIVEISRPVLQALWDKQGLYKAQRDGSRFYFLTGQRQSRPDKDSQQVRTSDGKSHKFIPHWNNTMK